MPIFSKIKNAFVGITKSEFIKGAIYAVILGTIAATPWILLRVYTGFFVGYLGYLIGYAALVGFKLGAGKEHKSALFIVVPFIILIIPLAEFISVYLSVLKTGEIVSPLEVLLVLRFTYDLDKDILINCVIGYVIAFLGTFSLLRRVRYSNSR